MTRVRWELGDRLSPLHAARCWAAGLPAIDPGLATALSEPMSELTQRLAAEEVDLSAFWQGLIADAAANQMGGAREGQETCRQALAAAGVGEWTLEVLASAVASRLAEIRITFQEKYPKLLQQLSLRARPLREQWEAFGPGLLRQIGLQTHERLLPRNVNVVLLSPYLGGGGDCDPPRATVWIEAVLTNPLPDLPEVLRLSWLIARAGLQQGLYADAEGNGIPTGNPRAANVLALALVPIVLRAAAELELGPGGDAEPDRLRAATEAWCGPLAPGTTEVVLDWWKQSQELNPAFPILLKALDRMLPGSSRLPWEPSA